MEAPDIILGRMKEGAHLAGYSFQRSFESLRWLLDGGRWKELSPEYENVNDFLRDIAPSFELLKINPIERKEIAQLVKEQAPEASQRAIADMVGVSDETVARDLGKRESATFVAPTDGGQAQIEEDIATFVAPAIVADNKNPNDYAKKEQQREIRQAEIQKKREEIAKSAESLPIDERWNVWQGDIRTWQSSKRYNFIITDPPYPREYLPLYEVLAKRALDLLKPDGLLIAMCGQSYLDQIYDMLNLHLNYYWTACYLLPGQPTPLRHRQVNTSWKPLLVFSPSNTYNGKIFGDVYISDSNDKDYHKWGQSISGMYSLISQICLPGQSILDPFCGAGTTGLAALKHGCLFDGIDLDMENVNISKGRLGGYDI